VDGVSDASNELTRRGARHTGSGVCMHLVALEHGRVHSNSVTDSIDGRQTAACYNGLLYIFICIYIPV